MFDVSGASLRSFSGPYFPVFEQNRDIYRVNLLAYSEYRKRWTRKTLNTGTFHVVPTLYL